MESGLKTVFSLFDGAKVFHVPDYQRPYAWDQNQLDNFVEDLENQPKDRPYFLGTTLLFLRQREGYFSHIEIVDGQQRLTTIVMFMKLLLDLLRSHDDIAIPIATYLRYHEVYKLQVLSLDNAFFRAYILEDNSVPQGLEETPSQRRLLSAKRHLHKNLKKRSLSSLRHLQGVLNDARILAYIVDTPSEAALIFETTNDRGKRLTDLEKTKSFLMYKAYVAFEHPEPQLKAIQEWFSSIYRDYDDIRDKRIDEDSILQYHFTAFEQWSSSRTYKGYQHYISEMKARVNSLVKAKESSKAQEYIERYPRELRQSFNAMNGLLLSNAGFVRSLFAVNRPANFYPLLVKCHIMDATRERRDFERLVRLAEIYTFRVLGIRKRRSDKGREKLYILARDFRGDFPRLLSTLKNMILEYCSDDAFRNRLMSGTFYEDITLGDQRYLFWQYENYLRRNEQPVASPMSHETFISQDARTRLTIEHIAPQKPKSSKIIRDPVIEPELTEEFRREYLHSLGNLTFDPASANASKGNNDVEAKNQRYFKKAPFKTQNELEGFLDEGTSTWSLASVLRRRDKIVQFAMDYWDPRKV